MSSVVQATASGEVHGKLGVIANSVKSDGFEHMKPETKAKAEKLKKEESRIVKARYINHQESAGKLEMPYCRWGGDLISNWRFINNHIYDLPLGLVNQVNGTSLTERSKLDTDDRNGAPKKTGIKRIHEFIPVGF